MGRLYRPSSVPSDDEPSTTLGTPGGRMYRPSSGVPEPTDGTSAPVPSATKKEWVAYAKQQGATDAQLRSMTRDSIAETYGPQPEAPEPPVDAAAETTQPEPITAAKDTSVATGALEPPADASTVTTDPAAETQQPAPIEAAQGAGGPAGVNQPKANAGRDEWVVFAQSQGATDEDLEGLGRNDIRAKYQADLI